MKMIHLSDLHIGKRVNGFQMIEDQKYILNEILDIIDQEKPDCIALAGDIYDKSVPSAEAVEVFDDFLVQLAELELQVFVISGNHDSPERLAFGGRLMDSSGIHFSPVYSGNVRPFSIKDEYGYADIFMLPFIKPANVRRFFPDEADDIITYQDAVKAAINNMPVDPERRSILITHQFVTGASRSESEDISVGGTDNIDASVFDAFDYTALGHIHGPQDISPGKIRYCGTPLKYSFSEAAHEKSVTVAEFYEKGKIYIRTVPLKPLRDMSEIKGRYDEITARSFYKDMPYGSDYMHITLTDEEDIPEAMNRLRVIYPNLMKLDYDNRRTREWGSDADAGNTEDKTPMQLFSEFYESQNSRKLSEEQIKVLESMIEDIWEDIR